MYSPHKHSYLQSRTQNVNPRIINRCVDRARSQPTIDPHDLEPPFNRLTSEQPGIPIRNVDVTRRPVAFGRWAMPKLRRELHHSDPSVSIQALMSIADLVHDPERGYEAITLRVPDRIADLLVHKMPSIRERACIALTVIACLAKGRAAITKNRLSLRNIGNLLVDMNGAVRFKAALLTETVSRTWTAADDMVAAGFVHLILKIIRREIQEIIVVHLKSLQNLMYGIGKDVAVKNGGFEIFVSLMERPDPTIKSLAVHCLTTVTSTYCGKEMAYDSFILQQLYPLLKHKNDDIHTAAASALTFCTIKSRAKIRAKEMLPGLADRLVELCGQFCNPTCQMFSMKALGNICEHPEVRKYVRDKYCQRLEAIIVAQDKDLYRYKKILLNIVNWVPWDEYRCTCHKGEND